MDPRVTSVCLNRLNGLTENEVSHQDRKILPRSLAQREPRPCSWVDVQDLVAAIPRVKFEFDLDKALEPDRGKQFSSSNLHRIVADNFHKGAGVAEFKGILPRPSRRHLHDRGIAVP